MLASAEKCVVLLNLARHSFPPLLFRLLAPPVKTHAHTHTQSKTPHHNYNGPQVGLELVGAIEKDQAEAARRASLYCNSYLLSLRTFFED